MTSRRDGRQGTIRVNKTLLDVNDSFPPSSLLTGFLRLTSRFRLAYTRLVKNHRMFLPCPSWLGTKGSPHLFRAARRHPSGDAPYPERRGHPPLVVRPGDVSDGTLTRCGRAFFCRSTSKPTSDHERRSFPGCAPRARLAVRQRPCPVIARRHGRGRGRTAHRVRHPDRMEGLLLASRGGRGGSASMRGDPAPPRCSCPHRSSEAEGPVFRLSSRPPPRPEKGRGRAPDASGARPLFGRMSPIYDATHRQIHSARCVLFRGGAGLLRAQPRPSASRQRPRRDGVRR